MSVNGLKNLSKKHTGLSWSLALHVALLVLILGGLPSFLAKEDIEIHSTVVDILPIKNVTKTKKQIVSPVKRIRTKPKPPPEPVKAKPVHIKPTKVAPTKVAPTKVAPTKVVPIKKVTPKPQKKKKIDDFESVLKTVEKIEKDATIPKVIEVHDSEIPLSMTEIDAIIRQISKNWSVPAGVRDAGDITVTLRLSLGKDGSVKAVKIVDQLRYSTGETIFQAAVDSAVRAAYNASPIKGLPLKKYSKWKELELTFDPIF